MAISKSSALVAAFGLVVSTFALPQEPALTFKDVPYPSRDNMATDYEVGIVNPGPSVPDGGPLPGTALNLYSITSRGVDLVEDYIPPQTGPTENLLGPLAVAMNSAHDFVYVAYQTKSGEPDLLAFQITPKGLVYRWQNKLMTGEPNLDSTTFTAGRDYVLENTHPVGDLYVLVYSQSGQLMVNDAGSASGNYDNLVSAHISPDERFYYSCIEVPVSTTPLTPTANTVRIYALSDRKILDTSSAEPLAISTDPVFVANVCAPTPPTYFNGGL